NGDFDVVEGYFETLIPLGLGVDFNGAARIADYSTSGVVKAWKLGLTFSPVDDVTLRTTRSRDIRAPNLGELFATGTARGNTVPINGVPVPFQQKLQGSTKLQPEEADGWNAGIVVQPSFLPGFGASVDYYDIEVDGVISSVSAEQTTSFFFESNVQAYCDNMHFAEPGNPLSLHTIDLFYERLNCRKAKRLAIAVSYQFDLSNLVRGWP